MTDRHYRAADFFRQAARNRVFVTVRNLQASTHISLTALRALKTSSFMGAGEQREKEVNRPFRYSPRGNQEDEARHYEGGSIYRAVLCQSPLLQRLQSAFCLWQRICLPSAYMIVGVVAVFGSFGPVIAISALPGNLTQTFAFGRQSFESSCGNTCRNTRGERRKDYIMTISRSVIFPSLTTDRHKCLQDICMHAEKGEIIGIVGESWMR